MQFVAFSDAHFYTNSSKSYIVPSGYSSWLEEQLGIVESIFTYARKNDVEMVIHNGDLFEEKNRINVPVYNKVFELFADHSDKLDIVLNTGNHDVFTADLDSSLKPFSSICRVITEPQAFTLKEDTTLFFFPFGQFNIEENYPIPKDTYNVLFLHEVIAGLSTGTSSYQIGSEVKTNYLSKWNLVLNGHIHSPQQMNNITNIGSIMPQDFGEAGEQKRFIHFKDGEIKSIPIDHPKFIILDGLSEKLNGKLENNNRDFFRLDIDSSELSNKIFNKFNVFPNIVKSRERKIRLKETKSEGEELQEYLNIVDTSLDKERLLRWGKKFIEEE